MSDIVERLRRQSDIAEGLLGVERSERCAVWHIEADGALKAMPAALAHIEAQAAEIARLRTALEDIADERGRCGACGRQSERDAPSCTPIDCEGRCFWAPGDPVQMARAALASEAPRDA